MNETLLALAASVAVSASAQGTLLFSNYPIDGKPRITTADGVRLTGDANYLVDLVVKGVTSLTDTATGLPLQPLRFFNSAFNAGSFAGTTVQIDGIPGGPDARAEVTVRAWDSTTGATYELATVKGSFTFSQMGLGIYSTPLAAVPLMSGFKAFSLTPEPSTYALAALGLGGLLFLRRK